MDERNDPKRDDGHEDASGEVGSSDDSPAADRLPALPADDDSALGDTDQHSDA